MENKELRKFTNEKMLLEKFKEKYDNFSIFIENNNTTKFYKMSHFVEFLDVKVKENNENIFSEIKGLIKEGKNKEFPAVIFYEQDSIVIFIQENYSEPFFAAYANIYKFNCDPISGSVIIPNIYSKEFLNLESKVTFKWLFEDGFAEYMFEDVDRRKVFEEFGIPEKLIDERFLNGK